MSKNEKNDISAPEVSTTPDNVSNKDIISVSGHVSPLNKDILLRPALTGLKLGYTLHIDCSDASREELISVVSRPQSLIVWQQNTRLRVNIEKYCNEGISEFTVTLADYLKSNRRAKSPQEKTLKQTEKMTNAELQKTIDAMMQIMQDRISTK
jgi:hypothetical protein